MKELEDQNFTPVSANICQDVGDSTFSICSSLDFDFSDGELEAGVYRGYIENPEPKLCSTEVPFTFEVISAPVLDRVIADFECVEQGDESLRLEGSHFIVLTDGTLPTVSIGDQDLSADQALDCTPLLGSAGGQTCNTLLVTIPEDLYTSGEYDVVVTNPEPVDCQSSQSVAIEFYPRPEITSLNHQLDCVDQSEKTFVIEGTGFWS